MKRAIITSFLLIPLVSICLSGVYADMIPARILLGAREAVVAPQPVYDGTRVLAPVSIIKSLNASHVESPDGNKITLISANGQSEDIETVKVNDIPMLPMDKVMKLIGGESIWNDSSHTLTLLAYITSVEIVEDTLKINCSLPVNCTASKWDKKIILDIAGAKLATEANEISIGTPLVTKARLGEPTDTTARIVLDLVKDAGGKFVSDPVSSRIAFKVGENLPNPAAQNHADTKQPAAKSYSINSVKLDTVDTDRFNLVIATSAKASVNTAFGVAPPKIVLNLPGGMLPDSVENIGSNLLLKGIKCSQISKGAAGAKIVLDLARVSAYNIKVENDQVTLSVRPPDHSGGSLADKFIVIDPGHGGSQKGAVCAGTNEKDINLKLANALADDLRREGARVVLTRSSDIVMGLAARSEVAINSGADFFISLHCNSNGSQNSASGIETYYHMQEASPMALAYAIHNGVCTTTGMCDRKPRSDRSLYTTGLAVLRRLENTGIPGVLVECGYINHSSDRSRLIDSEYQAKVAAGIVSGLKAYIEGAD